MILSKASRAILPTALLGLSLYMVGCQASPADLSESQAVTKVSASAETAPILGSGDADDVAVWVHPSNRGRSVILGTNKSKDGAGGLYAFGLNGRRLNSDGWVTNVNRFENERYNSVDLRYNFPAGGERWDIVAASNRSDREIDLFRVLKTKQGDFAGLQKVGELPLGPGLAPGSDAPYGLSLYTSQASKRLYVLISDKAGKVAQYRLSYNASGSVNDENLITAQRLGLWDISQNGTPVEGIVADDEGEVIYIASEDRGIYRYATAEGILKPQSRVVVDTPSNSPDARLRADIEGLTLYYAANGQGYLIASSQGSDSFAIYERAFSSGKPNAYVSEFTLSAGSVDAVSNTDGLDVVSVNLGGAYREGLFLAHDGEGNSPSNYNLVPWRSVAADKLRVDTSQDPRRLTP